MIYVPGDNEWTDCHRTAQDPIERLGYIRRSLFATNRSFGKATLIIDQQLPQIPENSRWRMNSVVFVGLNVPGSNDNHINDVNADEAGTPRGSADRRAAEAEYQARDQADRDWLHQSFEVASRTGAAGVVVFMQADPGFEVPHPLRAAAHVDGFDSLLGAFVAEAKAFAKPVVIVHGDSHRFRIDHPLVDPTAGQPLPNVTRIETFGSPNVGWVQATIDPSSPELVSVQSHLVATTAG